MTIEGSAAYLHARYEKGSRFENQLVGGELVEVDRSGEPITQAPKWTASIGATQEFEFEAGILKLHADYAYIASRYFDYFTTGDPAQEEADRKSVVQGKSVSVRVDLGGRRIIKKKKIKNEKHTIKK